MKEGEEGELKDGSGDEQSQKRSTNLIELIKIILCLTS